MQATLVFAFLLVSTIHVVHADTHRNSAAAKEQTCSGQASDETTTDHEKILLARQKAHVHVQESTSTEKRGKHDLLQEASQQLVSSGYITDMKVINGKHTRCGEGWEKVSGPTLSGDLNQDCGSGTDFIWFCVKKGSDNWLFTDLTVVASSSSMSGCGMGGWQQIPATDGSNGDLNQGAGGKYIYLCFQKDADKAPLSELKLTETHCEAGMFGVPTSGSNGDLNQGGGGKDIFLCAKRALPQCQGNDVKGEWKYIKKYQVETTVTFRTGTEKTKDETKTSSWSQSVSATVSAGYACGSLEVTGTLAQDASSTYGSTWSTSTETEIQRHFAGDNLNKAVWQFQFHVMDTCDNSVVSKTEEFALTSSKDQLPCCLPGYNVDPAYQTCTRPEVTIC
jgi:hypothetical protein